MMRFEPEDLKQLKVQFLNAYFEKNKDKIFLVLQKAAVNKQLSTLLFSCLEGSAFTLFEIAMTNDVVLKLILSAAENDISLVEKIFEWDNFTIVEHSIRINKPELLEFLSARAATVPGLIAKIYMRNGLSNLFALIHPSVVKDQKPGFYRVLLNASVASPGLLEKSFCGNVTIARFGNEFFQYPHIFKELSELQLNELLTAIQSLPLPQLLALLSADNFMVLKTILLFNDLNGEYKISAERMNEFLREIRTKFMRFNNAALTAMPADLHIYVTSDKGDCPVVDLIVKFNTPDSIDVEQIGEVAAIEAWITDIMTVVSPAATDACYQLLAIALDPTRSVLAEMQITFALFSPESLNGLITYLLTESSVALYHEGLTRLSTSLIKNSEPSVLHAVVLQQVEATDEKAFLHEFDFATFNKQFELDLPRAPTTLFAQPGVNLKAIQLAAYRSLMFYLERQPAKTTVDCDRKISILNFALTQPVFQPRAETIPTAAECDVIREIRLKIHELQQMKRDLEPPTQSLGCY